MESSHIVVYAGLDDTETARALFRSLPMTTNMVSGEKGLIFFALPGMEKVDEEEGRRSVVKSGELAYWVGGNSLCIGYAKTSQSRGNEIRLYYKCNIFGESFYKVIIYIIIISYHSVDEKFQ